MRGVVLGALVGGVLTAAVFLSNPDVDEHREAINAQLAVDHPLAAALGLGTIKGLAVEYHSIGIASWTSREDRVMTFGALGNVWVTARD